MGGEAQAERDAIVAWLEREAEDMRMEFVKGGEMAPLYAARSTYYGQAASMIRRGAHLRTKCDEPSASGAIGG